ncbi:MAG: head GIN domain-containing protein [Chitinophagaceae bacterium]
MKKLLIVLLVFFNINSFAQRLESIKGNGQMKKETREVSNYTSLASQGSMDVQIAYGNSNSVVVEADENLLPYIETFVDNGKLTIKSKKGVNLKSGFKMVVNVSMKKINSLQQSGSGNINGSGAFTSDGKTDIAVSGSGNLKLNFDSFKDLDLSLSGSGNVDLKSGNTNNLNAKISGSGNIDCSTVTSKDVDAKISGSGNIKVYASNSIDAKISGSGNVFYKGSAQNVSSKVVGSGKVMRM